MSLDWLLHCAESRLLEQLAGCLLGYAGPGDTGFCQESGEREEVRAVKDRAAMAAKAFFSYFLYRPFTTDLYLSSISCFLSGLLVLPINK